MTDRRDGQLRLLVNMQSAGAHPAAWRAPDVDPLGCLNVGYYQQIAREAERGLFDAVFLADHNAFPRQIGTRPGWTLDPLVVLTAVAAVTSSIGLVASQSTTFHHPYNIARSLLSLQHASGGRAGWNVVTTWEENAARNYDLPHLPGKAERYRRADEFVRVVTGLWQGWEPDGLVADTVSGQYVDTERVHALDHHGEFFTVAGPLQVPPSPWGPPAIFQAGGSEYGRNLAAQHADGVFSAQTQLAEAQAYRADLTQRAGAHHRPPPAVCPGVVVVVASTHDAAWDKRRALDDIVGDEQTRLNAFAASYGLSGERLDPDAPFPTHLVERVTARIPQAGFQDAAVALLTDPARTVREVVTGGGIGHRSLVGSPGEVADSLEEWYVTGAADGFVVMVDKSPSGLSDFVDLVVPELQRRGLYRRAYQPGSLAERLRPAPTKTLVS